ncbi:hypothetical protein GOA91_20460 [Sinorhizobium meliloti]|nr:hypothetical protein [Sinorhizobium meliloti]MDX0275815.1 hypothetical protein [Sinorhizobium meliloti]
MKTFAMCLAISFSASVPATAATAIPAGKPTSEITCSQATEFVAKLADSDSSIEEYNSNMAIFQQCMAVRFSKKQEQEKKRERVIATGTAVNGKIVIYELITVDPDDAAQVKQVCQAAAEAVGLTVADPVTSILVTTAGQVSCGSYVDAALRSDPLLIVAPTLLPGIDVTKDVLRAAGIPEDKIEEAERTLRDVGKKGVKAAGDTAVAAITGGLVREIPPKLPRCAVIFGKRVCR